MVTLSLPIFGFICAIMGAGIICAFILLLLAIGGHIRT